MLRKLFLSMTLIMVFSPAIAQVQVFVTWLSYDGNFPGLAGADAACTTAATDAGHTGTWTAWLSDSANGTDTDARDRILDGEYQLLDGTVVATSLADLTDGTLNVPINMDETGTPIPGGAVQVWTGTATDGTHQGAGLCTDWTSNSSDLVAGIGDLSAADANWTDVGGGNNCDLYNRLYCFSDVEASPPPATSATTNIPTLSVWALITLAVLFGLMVFANRRRLFKS